MLPFIEILEKRLNTIDSAGYNWLGKHERRFFELGATGKDFPQSELPDSLLEEMEEYGFSEDKFMDACSDAYHDGRAKFNEAELYNPKRAFHIDLEEQREAAMQAGMAFGCQGYNDEMGY